MELNLELANIELSKEVTQLLMLNNILLGKDLPIFSYSERLDTIIDSCVNGTEFLIFSKPYDASPLNTTTKIKAWKKETVDSLINQGAEYLELISTALSTKNSLTLMFKYQSTYIAIQSSRSRFDQGALYKQLAACMLLEHSSSSDLVLRLTDAIQKTELLEYTQEELDLIDKKLTQVRTAKMFKELKDLISQKRPTEDILRVQEKIRQLTNEIIQHQARLRELQAKDYMIEAGLTDQEELMAEFKDYLMDSDFIIDYRNRRESMLRLTIQSYIYIPEEDKDFVKPESIAHVNHYLYEKPYATQLIKDIIDQRVRMPITATYEIESYENRVSRIRGIRGWASDNRDPATYIYPANHHIDYYDCFDGYRREMTAALNDSDPIKFFETARQCTATINVFDSAVIRRIIPQLEEYTGGILYRGDNNEWVTLTREEYINETS